MKYNCKKCTFHWDGNSDTFDKVLIHEKTHLRKVVAQWSFVIPAIMSIMINAWEKLACLNAVVNFVNKTTSQDARNMCS